jgi:hypothetical protein
MRYLQLTWLGFLLTLLAACGSQATPEPSHTPSPPEPAATATPVDTPTAEPTPEPATETPTSSPTPEPTEAEAEASYNEDLDYAQVRFVEARQGSDGLWRFSATVRHNDEGWDHYADAWQVVAPDGTVLAERVLAHPHDNEQPFTRSQGNIEIPAGVTRVTVRAKCNVHGFGGQEVRVDLTQSEGEDFEVSRAE